MKKLLSLQILTALICLLSAGQIFAQEYTSYNEERPLPKYLRYWQLLDSDASSYPEVSNKALLAFKKKFVNANDIQWSIVENKYMVRFINDGRINRVLYDKKGHTVYSISEGTVKNLPADIRKAVRSIYFDYTITMTTEVHILEKTAWIINMEDEKSIVIVKVLDNEVVETGHYQKSK
jgi:hypothetical protein